MSAQFDRGAFAPISLQNLSFTLVCDFYIGLSLGTNWKFATFRLGQSLNPYLAHYRELLRSPVSFTRWIVVSSLQLTYSVVLRIHRAYRVPCI